MTKQFDTLLEQMHSELISEAPIAMDSPETTKEVVNKIVNNIISAEGKGHWYNALNSKELKDLKENPEKVKEKATELVWNVVKIILPERDNTYNPDITRADLKKGDILKDAIKNVFKMSETYSAFLRDRFSNDALLGLVKDVVETGVRSSKDGEGVQLVPVAPEITTQKEFKQALKQALEEAPKEQEPSKTEDEKKETDSNVEKVYTKAADLVSDDADLQRAFKKLPDDKEMSWEEVVKTIKMSPALALLDAGGLVETEKEIEAGEEEYGSKHKELDIDDEDSADLSNFDKFIDPYFSTTRRAGGPLGWD